MKSRPTPIKPQAPTDPLANFCEELCGPLEEIFNLIYIVRHKQTDSALAKRYLNVVDERLSELRELVFTYCQPRDKQIKKAS